MNKRSIEPAMGRYQQEVVRWNRQINLVSRKGTFGLVAALIRQCRDAFSVLHSSELADERAQGPFWYFDLGSGGGLPGFVWHHELLCSFPLVKTWLVEPREKRAWFLGRLNQISPEAPVCVLEGLWGDEAAEVDDLETPATILVSLKALRLTDEVVLSGLVATVPGLDNFKGCRVLIARFYPPKQRWNEEIQAELAPFSDDWTCDGCTFSPSGQAILPPVGNVERPAALAISRYDILP